MPTLFVQVHRSGWFGFLMFLLVVAVVGGGFAAWFKFGATDAQVRFAARPWLQQRRNASQLREL